MINHTNDTQINNGYLSIGTVANTHGVRGEVKVFPYTFDVNRFGLLREVIVIADGGERAYAIERARAHKQCVILKLTGVDDMTAAERLKGALLCIPKSLALPLEEDEYYIGDVIGCAAYDADGAFIGEVTDILETGANDVYIINQPGDGEILLPAVKQYVLAVDIANKRITVELPVYEP